jgi:hypothetical protein
LNVYDTSSIELYCTSDKLFGAHGAAQRGIGAFAPRTTTIGK